MVGLQGLSGIALALCLLGGAEAMADDTDLADQITQAFEAGELDGLHGVLIVHEGDVLAETYFTGLDERWGVSLGVREHGPETLHDIRSVTKSVVSLLYGIALAEGLVPAPDDSLIDQFPEFSDLADDPLKNTMTVRDVLSMKMGIKWNENVPYTSADNSEVAMELADDRYRYVLEQPMLDKPGEQWVYNGGAVALIGQLITKGVGMSIDAYAKARLFDPLGISEFEWIRGDDDVPSAASGLRLTLPDLVKIGMLVNDQGAFDGKQIVPQSWLDASLSPHSSLPDEGLRYGYLWWLAPWGDPPAWVAGFGNGGQRLTIQAEHNLVIAIYAGNYNQADAWRIPVKIISDFVVPVIEARISSK